MLIITRRTLHLLQIFCLFPSEAAIWIALLVASATSAIFLVRNLVPLIMVSAPQNVKSITMGVCFTQVLFALLLKFLVF